jgi:DHA1 family bicyclomycin/chloramphenicol resistance-like MFS transporter
MGSTSPVSRPPIWLLTTLTGAGTLGMHIFAPALPLVAADFAASPATTQYTVSLYMVALAVGQLVYGPLSDRFGRRPLLLGGLTLFLIAGLAATAAQNMQMLVLARVAQGLGGCAGFVLGRAIVQDVTEGADGARTIATLNIIQLCVSAVAPVVGLAIAAHLGWRAIPAILCLLALVAILGAYLVLPETRARAVTKRKAGAYRAVFRAPGFLVNLTVGAFTTTSLYNLLSTMPFVVTGNLGHPEGEVGYYYFILVAGIISGGYLIRTLAGRVSLPCVIMATTALGALAGATMLSLALSGALGLIAYLALGFVFTVTCGVMGVAALAETAANVGDLKGTAVGLYGFTQMATGALMIMLGSLGPDVLFTSSLTLAAFACAGFGVYVADRLRR